MDDFRWAYEINVFAPFRLTQLAVPHMEAAGGGAVLNISSMSAENKNVRMASYSSSKAAISHLTRNIAFDLGPKNIRVNGIAPGAIRTAALATVLTPRSSRPCSSTRRSSAWASPRTSRAPRSSLFARRELGQRPDPDRLRRWRAGTRLTRTRLQGRLTTGPYRPIQDKGRHP
jgi:NAD(P)-dependent dehydrogenase (short-subunit alcohol dehydrogenase family)